MNRAPARFSRLVLAAATWSMAVAGPGVADVIRLKNGQSLEGDAVESGGQVAIRSAVGTISVPASLVLRIDRGTSVEQQALQRLDALRADDLESRVELAVELQDAGANTLAQRIFGEVLQRDPDHPAARRALGYVRCDDQWLTDDECHRAHGEVLFGGLWVTAEQRSVLEALEHQRRRNDLERLRAEIQVETALLAAERQAEPAGYGGSGADPFGYPYDDEYDGLGVPYWPLYPVAPYPHGVVGHGRFPRDGMSHDGRHGDRPRHFDGSGVHHRGGQAPRPSAPSANGRAPAPSTTGARSATRH